MMKQTYQSLRQREMRDDAVAFLFGLFVVLTIWGGVLLVTMACRI